MNLTHSENSFRVTKPDLKIQTSHIKLCSKNIKETWNQNLEQNGT